MSGEQILHIPLSPSRGLAATIVIVHGGAGVCAGALVPGAMGMLLGVLVAALGFAATWDRALLRGRRSLRALQIGDKDSVTLELANTERVALRISPRRYVSGLVVVLLATSSMHRTIVVARDMLDADSFRTLRLWALWGRVPNPGTGNSLTKTHGLKRTIF